MTKPNKSTSDRVYISKGIPYIHMRCSHMRAPFGILHGEWTSSFLCVSVNDNIKGMVSWLVTVVGTTTDMNATGHYKGQYVGNTIIHNYPHYINVWHNHNNDG